jgi:hypothetical protein
MRGLLLADRIPFTSRSMGYSIWLFRTQDSLNIAHPALIRPESSARRTVRD